MTADKQLRAGCTIGKDYPAPIVDHATAYRIARERMSEIRRRQKTRDEAKRVYAKHGSRRRPRSRRSGTRHA